MYQYTDFDRHFVHQRAAQFRDQLSRHFAGQLPDEDFRPLRLQNGWYVQRHAPMLRVAVPLRRTLQPPIAGPGAHRA
jgi:sulfite reductase (NADPH) hemoprotein beta-component